MRNTLILFVLLAMTACGGDDEDAIDYTEQNDQEIQAYLAADSLTAQKSATGLYYIIDTVQNDPIDTTLIRTHPTSTSNVTVAYKGYYTNKNVFDESSANGISFNLQQVIKGWTEGITYFKEGEKGILLIPAHLGYGSNDSRGIPGGSVLIFDIHLISID